MIMSQFITLLRCVDCDDDVKINITLLMKIVVKCCLCGRCQLQTSNIINSICNAHGLLQESLAFKWLSKKCWTFSNDCMASWKVLIFSGGGSISAMLSSCTSLAIVLVICITPKMRQNTFVPSLTIKLHANWDTIFTIYILLQHATVLTIHCFSWSPEVPIHLQLKMGLFITGDHIHRIV